MMIGEADVVGRKIGKALDIERKNGIIIMYIYCIFCKRI